MDFKLLKVYFCAVKPGMGSGNLPNEIHCIFTVCEYGCEIEKLQHYKAVGVDA